MGQKQRYNVTREIRKDFELNKKHCQNVWDAVKAIFQGRFIISNTFINKKKDLKPVIYDFSLRTRKWQ